MKDSIGYKKELDSCKYIDETIGLEEDQGCFSKLTKNYDKLQDKLSHNSKLLDHYLEIYNNIGNPNRLKVTVSGIQYDNKVISTFNDNSYTTRKDAEQTKQELVDKIKKDMEEKSSSKQPIDEKQKKLDEEAKRKEEASKNKFSTPQEIQASMAKFSSDFEQRCRNNQKLKLENPKCYAFLQEKFSTLAFDPEGVQIIEYYRMVNALRNMLSLEMWNEMYDICAIKLQP